MAYIVKKKAPVSNEEEAAQYMESDCDESEQGTRKEPIEKQLVANLTGSRGITHCGQSESPSEFQSELELQSEPKDNQNSEQTTLCPVVRAVE